MAKKLSWGSFSHEDLRVDHEDDIYILFPFLRLKEMTMVGLTELLISDNAVRGIKDTVSQKLVGLSGSLFYGWDRTSWPVPFMTVKGEKEAFDRRHTVKVCRSINSGSIQKISEIPGAEYEREYPENGGIFNHFLDRSILTLAAMYGNVYGPIADDTRDYMFETACINILNREKGRHDVNLLTRSFVRNLLIYMGCYTRYNDNKMVIERIVTGVLNSFKNPETEKGKLTINNDISSMYDFINNSDDWQENNTENDTTIFSTLSIIDNAAHMRTYSERILHALCKNEKNISEGEEPKLYKVLLYNEKNSKQADKIVRSRTRLIESLNDIWYLRRDNILAPIKKMFNFDIPSKKLIDFNLEIWCMNQIDGEDEPFELLFDKEPEEEGV